MCEIIIIKGVTNDAIEYIRASAKYNPDGFGALTAGGVKKTFNIEKIIDHIKANPEWCIVHTRLATHGKITITNCHPFFLGDGWYLFMNGSLPFFHEVRSDTNILASLLQDKPIKKILQTLSTMTPRFVVANINGVYHKIGRFYQHKVGETEITTSSPDSSLEKEQYATKYIDLPKIKPTKNYEINFNNDFYNH